MSKMKKNLWRHVLQLGVIAGYCRIHFKSIRRRRGRPMSKPIVRSGDCNLS